MNKLLISACAAALMLPVSAGAADMHKDKHKDGAVKAKAETTVKTDKMDKSAKADNANAVYRTKTSLSGKELLGEGIHGAKGDRIARIDDIVLDANGKADKVVFLSGGVFGFGGTRGALDYNAIDIAYEDEDYEPVVSVSLSEEGIQSAVEYETEEMNDYSLISEIIGSKVNLIDDEDEDDDAVINDIILSDAGTVQHLIVQESVISSIGAGTKYAVPYAKLQVEQGAGGGLVLDMTEEQLEASPVYKASWRSQVGADMKQGWENTKDEVDEWDDDADDKLDD